MLDEKQIQDLAFLLTHRFPDTPVFGSPDDYFSFFEKLLQDWSDSFGEHAPQGRKDL